jgi:hypothetical protein
MFNERLQSIIDTLTSALDDAAKFDSGNDAAGRRVRTASQQAKNDLQQLRLDVQTERNNRKS